MKSLLFAVLVAICCGGCVPAQYPSHQQLAFELVGKSVALVQAEDDFVYCSGVWVSPTHILTAAHCMEDKDIGDSVQYAIIGDVVELPLNEVITPRFAVLVDTDEFHDLALLKAGLFVPTHPVAELSFDDINVGDPVETMGNPKGMVWSFSSGEVSAIRYLSIDDEPMWYIQSTAPISPGSSGGGLYDAKGKLIGITRAYVRGSENLNLFVHRDYLIHFLKDLS